MNIIIEFLADKWQVLAAAAGVAYGVVQSVVSSYHKQKNKIFEAIDKLINQVEHPGDGRDKLSEVTGKLFDKVPLAFRKLISKKRIKLWAQDAWENIQEYSDKQSG